MGDLRKILREPVLAATIAVIAASLFLFVIYPLFKVFQMSVVEDGRLTFHIYGDLLGKSYERRPVWNSLILGALVACAGTAVGYLFAFAITRADVPWKRFFRVIATFPIISPPFVLSLAAILMLGRKGFITRMLFQGQWDPHIYGLRGLVLVENIAFFPTAFLIMLGVLQAIEPALEESSLNPARRIPRPGDSL